MWLYQPRDHVDYELRTAEPEDPAQRLADAEITRRGLLAAAPLALLALILIAALLVRG